MARSFFDSGYACQKNRHHFGGLACGYGGFFACDGADDGGGVARVDMDLWFVGLGFGGPCVGGCCGFDEGWLGFEALSHASSCFELDGSLSGDGDAFEGLWVLGHAWGAVLDFKDAEIAELEAVAVCDFIDHEVKKLLYDLLCDDAFLSGALCDLIDEGFLGDRFHSFYLSVRCRCACGSGG